MSCRNPGQSCAEREVEDDLQPLRRTRPEGARRRPRLLRDWALVLPGVLTICVLAYAGRQSVGVSSAGPVPPVPAPAAVRAEPAGPRPAYPPVPLAKGDPKPLVEPVRQLSDVIALSNAVVEPRDEPRAAALEFQPTDLRTGARNLAFGDDALAVQRRLVDLGYLSTRATGVWGNQSRRALRSFKDVNGLTADESWDEATERALFGASAVSAPPYIGTWAIEAKACSAQAGSGGLLPTVIDSAGARAGAASCDFKGKRQAGAGWTMDAACRDGRERWTAHVQLTVAKGRLTWTSERGSQSYVRCG